MHEVTQSHQQWIAKHASRHIGVGTKLKEWQHSDDDKCPWCSDCEDTCHVWICQHPDARWLCLIKFAHLQQWMKDKKTVLELQHALSKRITTWSFGTPLHPLVTSSLMINNAILSQDEIGWTNFFEGCQARGWAEIQDLHYWSIDSHWIGLRWMIALIKNLWDVAWDLWEQCNGSQHDKLYQETLHQQSGLDNEICVQFRQGTANLLCRMHYLFDGEVDDLLKTSIAHCQKWLTTIQGARERATDTI